MKIQLVKETLKLTSAYIVKLDGEVKASSLSIEEALADYEALRDSLRSKPRVTVLMEEEI